VAGLQEAIQACSLPSGAYGHPSTRGVLGTPEAALNLLLRAGELECGLADAGYHKPTVAALTEAAARRLICLEEPVRLPTVDLADAPEEVAVSPAEGFVYYALHPLDFADLAAALPLKARSAAVVGIRSIGTTLSAVVVAALERRDMRASRMTVRPVGHPYDRQTRFAPEQLRWIGEQQECEAEFLVVDEGPGMSGSSFLSVGEALLEGGVQRERVHFLCSRQPDLGQLCARNAAARWQRFHACYIAQNSRLPQGAKLYAGGGCWRDEFYGSREEWPASWVQMERLKFWSDDKRTLFRFEGFGRYGAEVRQRAECVAAAGFGPMPLTHANGFAGYAVLQGRPLRRIDIDREVLDRMADYCAFRFSHLRALDPQNAQEMETMLRFNASEEFGVELEPSLASATPVLADGRMMPWEWIRTPEGRLLKTDAADHSDDHFFPGPTDIAWDLAGAIIEWDLPRQAADYLLERYRRASGDDPGPRMPGYLLAYTVFRMGYCKMAAAAVGGAEEEQRLLRDYRWYRNHAGVLLPQENLAAA
ncbi:MAG TPA: hypothetical protein VF767_06520, partial [Bryobacteraceae bacterium]